MAQSITHVSADDYEKLCKEKNFWNIDVREKYEFDVERIRGAKLVPATRFDEEFEKLKVKKNEKIGLYCRIGNRSDFIAKKLRDRGFKNIFNLELGIIDWKDHGKKVI